MTVLKTGSENIVVSDGTTISIEYCAEPLSPVIHNQTPLFAMRVTLTVTKKKEMSTFVDKYSKSVVIWLSNDELNGLYTNPIEFWAENVDCSIDMGGN